MPRRKGISPVIATVIIVAVTIAVAIAVAFWMTGIIGLFTGAVEKLEIVSATATATAIDEGSSGWKITVIARNTGTTQTTIDSIFVNGILAYQWDSSSSEYTKASTAPDCLGDDVVITAGAEGTATVKPGEQITIEITMSSGSCGTFTASPGVSLEVKLHTTGGKEYPKLLTLP